MDGAMAGCEGIFESETSRDRVTILLNVAGQYTRDDVCSGGAERTELLPSDAGASEPVEDWSLGGAQTYSGLCG